MDNIYWHHVLTYIRIHIHVYGTVPNGVCACVCVIYMFVKYVYIHKIVRKREMPGTTARLWPRYFTSNH